MRVSLRSLKLLVHILISSSFQTSETVTIYFICFCYTMLLTISCLNKSLWSLYQQISSLRQICMKSLRSTTLTSEETEWNIWLSERMTQRTDKFHLRTAKRLWSFWNTIMIVTLTVWEKISDTSIKLIWITVTLITAMIWELTVTVTNNMSCRTLFSHLLLSLNEAE